MSIHSPAQCTAYQNLEAVTNAIREAWYSGRRIVPIVGAGLSADSGFPVIRSVIRYLAKLRAVVDRGGPFGGCKTLESEARWGRLREKTRARYEGRHCYKFVADFGWPDRYQLNQDLGRLLRKEGNETITDTVVGVLNAITPELNPAVHYQFDELMKRVGEWAADGFTKRLSGQSDSSGGVPESLAALFSHHRGWSVPWDIYGDWRKLIQYFTGYHTDLADGLFSALGRFKSPNQGHRYLTFLIRLLSVRSVFTFNFDDLIERDLEAEGFRPKVFSMEEGRTLPHGSLADDVVSVVKLHGGTHSLLLDERLDRPLSDEYLKRFDLLVGPDPLLLVIGCSGGDYRLISLINHVLRSPVDGTENRVAWLHFEGYVHPFLLAQSRPEAGVAAGTRELRAGVVAAQVRQPWAALTQIYSSLTSRHPASTRPYPATTDRAGKYPSETASDHGRAVWDLLTGGDVVVRVRTVEDENFDKEPLLDGDFPVETAAEVLLDVAALGVERGYTPIAVNLEAAHTLAAVVGVIIDQCRLHDTALSPAALPAEDGDSTASIRKAVSLVTNALQRSRYLVLLDGLEAYLWHPLSHHGETTLGSGTLEDRFRTLCTFLTALKDSARDLGESRVVVGMDPRRVRTVPGAGRGKIIDLQTVLLVKTELSKKIKSVTMGQAKQTFSEVYAQLTAPSAPFITTTRQPVVALEKSNELTALVLLLLTACRRTRPLAMVRHVLRPLFGSPASVDAAIGELVGDGRTGFVRIEGGAIWISRPVRNYIYAANTEHASRPAMQKLHDSEEPDEDHIQNCVVQLVLAVAVHHRLSRSYYVYNFGQSQDGNVFLEYTYHRISCLRYLVKLIAVVKKFRNTHTVVVLQGLQRAGDFLKAALGVGERYEKALLRFQLRPETDLYRAVCGASTTGSEQPDSPKGGSELLKLVVEELESRHGKESRALYGAWRRHEHTLRLQLPAQQLLHWCAALTREELPIRCERVILEYGDPPNIDALTYWGGPDHFVVESPPIHHLQGLVQDFQVKLWAERGDYREVVAARCNSLDVPVPTSDRFDSTVNELCLRLAHKTIGEIEPAPVGAAPTQAPTASEADTPALLGKFIPQCLDIANAMLKYSQIDDPEALRPAKRLLECIDQRLNQLRPPSDAVREAWARTSLAFDFHEAVLRCKHLYAEASMAHVSAFARGFREDLLANIESAAHDKVAVVDQVAGICDLGLEENRYQEPAGPQAPRSIVIDRTADGTLYQQYRTVFDGCRARATWLTLTRTLPPEAHEKLPYYEDHFAEHYRGEFQTVFRYFQLARGGLGQSNPLLAALTEIYTAEACLGLARFQMHRAHRRATTRHEPWEWVSRVIGEVKAKHETARGCLHRASLQLLNARRNVIWWSLFYSMVGQYQADRLIIQYLDGLWAYAKLTGENEKTAPTAESPENSYQIGQLHSAATLPQVIEAEPAVTRPMATDQRDLVSEAKSGRANNLSESGMSGTITEVYRMLPTVRGRIRRGYNAIRAAGEFRSSPRPNPWHQRIWHEITLSGIGLAALGLRCAGTGLAGQQDWPDLIGDVFERLHESERLSGHAAADIASSDKYRMLAEEWLSSHNAFFTGTAVPDRLFELRKKLLESAGNPFGKVGK